MTTQVCESTALVEEGAGVRFEVCSPEGERSAFALRWRGRIVAYVNRCAHIGVELDWVPGQFLDESSEYIVCATHGALYDPSSGLCVAGPCKGRHLEPLVVSECDGKVVLVGNNTRVVRSEAGHG